MFSCKNTLSRIVLLELRDSVKNVDQQNFVVELIFQMVTSVLCQFMLLICLIHQVSVAVVVAKSCIYIYIYIYIYKYNYG